MRVRVRCCGQRARRDGPAAQGKTGLRVQVHPLGMRPTRPTLADSHRCDCTRRACGRALRSAMIVALMIWTHVGLPTGARMGPLLPSARMCLPLNPMRRCQMAVRLRLGRRATREATSRGTPGTSPRPSASPRARRRTISFSVAHLPLGRVRPVACVACIGRINGVRGIEHHTSWHIRECNASTCSAR